MAQLISECTVMTILEKITQNKPVITLDKVKTYFGVNSDEFTLQELGVYYEQNPYDLIEELIYLLNKVMNIYHDKVDEKANKSNGNAFATCPKNGHRCKATVKLDFDVCGEFVIVLMNDINDDYHCGDHSLSDWIEPMKKFGFSDFTDIDND